MRLLPEKLRKLAKNKGLSLDNLLKKAGVSKTAYYHLSKKENLFPKSLLALAKALEVPVSDFTGNPDNPDKKFLKRRKEMESILKKAPQLDPENVWHTLILLELRPWQRLDRGLLRAQKSHFHP